MQAPVMVLNTNTQRETGRTAQLSNISAARSVADIIRTTLGPRAMLKMIMDAMGGIVITNDGHCILREVDVSHPAAKSMIELSRAQNEEVGDGTTSVIILTGELLSYAEPFIKKNIHPTLIISGYNKALQSALKCMEGICRTVDLHNKEEMTKIVLSCIGTKFSSRLGPLMVDLALNSVLKVATESGGYKECDTKRYVRIEKIPGGELDDCRVLNGVMFNKDITHSKMRRRIEKPRVLLLDCPLEYKKGESGTQVEVTKEEEWSTLLKMEEEFIEQMCAEIIAFKPDIVITEKGCSVLAEHYFMKAGITCFRRLRKSDNNRVARATGATIVSRTDEIQESDIGTKCGLFEVRKIGDEYFTFLEDCEDPKACTVLLRGGSKDVLNELERNLDDAIRVVRNIVFENRLLPGGGATEMAVAQALVRESSSIEGVAQWPFKAVGQALEVIPRTLAANCGANVVRLLTELRAKHLNGLENSTWGIDGEKGSLVDMNEFGIWEPYAVKIQTVKTAIESANLLLRIDDIVSGAKPTQR